MGSIANRIDYDAESQTAEAKFTFTPGVNGDYAYPGAFYKVIEAPVNDNFKISDYEVKMNATDHIKMDGEYAKHNEANLTISK